jgi:hypothetical protein
VVGTVFSHNRGGAYMRGRTMPVNPNTELQAISRENLTAAANFWKDNLTDPQRQAWATYADGTPVVNRVGDQRTLSGQQMFVRSATARLSAGVPIVGEGPTATGGGPMPTESVVLTLGITDGLEGTFEIVEPAVGTVIAVYLGRPVSPSRTPAHESERFVAAVAVDESDFPVLVATSALPWDFTVGQKTRLRAVALQGDGRTSGDFIRDLVVEA